MKPLAPNTMIQNRYLIVHLIGKGGMGEVYLAVDQRLGSAVALKRTFFNEDKELGNAFEREARILARLRHPVLPKVIDHFMENNDQFLVMEHISGDDLAKRLENANKPFPLSWVMFWADQMLDALNYLHSHEPPIIHRDIKPQNLKLTDENHIVLLDFGLSKDFDRNSSGQPLNSASVVGYSPHFASMEQVRGTGTDARSDIYSLSATLYQLMTGGVPVDALTRADSLLGGAKDPIVPISEVNSEVPKAVSDVVLKGLAVRQDERFSAAVDMQKALRRAFNSGKAGQDVQTAIDTGEAQASPFDSSSPEAEVPETITKTRSGSGAAALDSLPKTDSLGGSGAVKQSDVKTAIFSAPDVSVQEISPEPPPTLVPPPAAAIPAAAGASAAGQAPPVAAQPAAASQQPAGKSSSKTGLVVGGLVGLLLLVGIAVGAGWYVYANYFVAATPVATPAPTAQPEPSPAGTVEVLADANQNGNSNSIAEQVTDPVPGDDNTNQTAEITQEPGAPTRSTSTTTSKSTSPKTSQTPVPKATPKPKARDDRTVILQ